MSSRQPEMRLWLAAITGLLVPVAWALFAASFDMLEATRHAPTSSGFRVTPRLDFLLWERGVEAFFGVWFFALGASVGSFLNVVAYRMPIGISLAKSGSRCPRCRTPIRAQDNIPVLGWIALGGRCRACELPISRRYPIVEALTGAAFFLFYLGRLVQGSNGPQDHPLAQPVNVTHVLLDGRWDVIALYTLHVVGFAFVWGATLMLFDRNAPPRRFWITAITSLLALVVVMPLAAQWLMPERLQVNLALIPIHPWLTWPPQASNNLWLNSLFNLLLSAVTAGLIGSVTWLLASRLKHEPDRIATPEDSSPGEEATHPATQEASNEIVAKEVSEVETVLPETRAASNLEFAETNSEQSHDASHDESLRSVESVENEPRSEEPVIQILEGELGEAAMHSVAAADLNSGIQDADSDLPPVKQFAELDPYEPIVVPTSGSRIEPWFLLPLIIGLTWGWETLLIATLLSSPIFVIALGLTGSRSQWLSWWAIANSISLLLIAPFWTEWIDWLSPLR